MKSAVYSPGHLDWKTVQSANIIRISVVHFADTWCKVKKQCIKNWYIGRAVHRPSWGWPRAATRLRAATRPPVTFSPLANAGPSVAIWNSFVLIAAPNIWRLVLHSSGCDTPKTGNASPRYTKTRNTRILYVLSALKWQRYKDFNNPFPQRAMIFILPELSAPGLAPATQF